MHRYLLVALLIVMPASVWANVADQGKAVLERGGEQTTHALVALGSESPRAAADIFVLVGTDQLELLPDIVNALYVRLGRESFDQAIQLAQTMLQDNQEIAALLANLATRMRDGGIGFELEMEIVNSPS